MAGRLTADPELRYTPDGKAVASFNLAVDRPGKKDENSKADFFRVEAWEKLADIIVQYLQKGSPIIIQGSLRTDSWEKDGERKYITKIVANQMRFLPGGKKREESAAAPTGSDSPGDEDVPF